MHPVLRCERCHADAAGAGCSHSVHFLVRESCSRSFLWFRRRADQKVIRLPGEVGIPVDAFIPRGNQPLNPRSTVPATLHCFHPRCLTEHATSVAWDRGRRHGGCRDRPGLGDTPGGQGRRSVTAWCCQEGRTRKALRCRKPSDSSVSTSAPGTAATTRCSDGSCTPTSSPIHPVMPPSTASMVRSPRGKPRTPGSVS